MRGRNTALDERVRERAALHAAKLDRFGVPLDRVDIEISHERNPRLHDQAYKVEFTCRGHGPAVRAEASAVDEATALDRAVDRIEERLRRAADRRTSRSRRSIREAVVPPLAGPGDQRGTSPGTSPDSIRETLPASFPVEDADVVYSEGPVIVREKTHLSRPMSVAEAVEELELVDHDFFLFLDSAVGLPSVVYRRRGYSYGVLRLVAD